MVETPDYQYFLVTHLHRIYCAKTQLADKLPLLGQRAVFVNLRHAMAETTDTVRLQIARLKDVYVLLHSHYSPESCIGLTGVLDEAYQSVGLQVKSDAERDLSLLFYMQTIESIEQTSFRLMHQVAVKLKEPDVSKLLLECYDEARENKALFKALTAEYLK